VPKSEKKFVVAYYNEFFILTTEDACACSGSAALPSIG
jgi:hypothetical protein